RPSNLDPFLFTLFDCPPSLRGVGMHVRFTEYSTNCNPLLTDGSLRSKVTQQRLRAENAVVIALLRSLERLFLRRRNDETNYGCGAVDCIRRERDRGAGPGYGHCTNPNGRQEKTGGQEIRAQYFRAD